MIAAMIDLKNEQIGDNPLWYGPFRYMSGAVVKQSKHHPSANATSDQKIWMLWEKKKSLLLS